MDGVRMALETPIARRPAHKRGPAVIAELEQIVEDNWTRPTN
ncbi:hypothetical protein SAMN04489835_2848 [Mycolicibacterium rutilum]|uniref:Uncharacterized protein n=1 Tax=Mycolicibacterium rutilum TaxID=370526 RepID=A0A1H6K0D9_MYCRU|nr:hypothetical protein [Mycolicibacterium rutilum]SEH68397.1 hypothetical protein SAMN04489835_2848 [Mycolicibacterium rutilum]